MSAAWVFQKDFRHQINQSTTNTIPKEWVDSIHHLTCGFELLSIHDLRSCQCGVYAVDKQMPKKFKATLSPSRALIDAAEIKCELPSSLLLQYPDYKSSSIFECLVGMSANETLPFVSGLATGCISDKELANCGRFRSWHFKKESYVTTEKQFPIRDLLKAPGMHLNMPPFVRNDQFSEEDIAETEEIATLQIREGKKPIISAPLENQI